jgi:methoxymalonate biosynthesis acyl carrier protein
MESMVQSQIRGFIADRYPDAKFTNDEDIFSLGFVNSLFAMELIMFIEKAFCLTLPNHELRLDNFRTTQAMADLVDRLSASSYVKLDAP